MTAPGTRRVLATEDVAAAFGVDPKTVARWDKEGVFCASFRTPGGHRRWYADVVEAFLAEQTGGEQS